MSPRGPAGPGRPTGEVRAVVLAAGAARRFGGPKQLAPLDGRPLLAHALDLVRDLRPVVVLGAHAERIAAAVDLAGVEVVTCADWASGQAASLRAGIAAVGPGPGAALVLLGDQPRLTRAVVEGTLGRRDDAAWDAVRPTFGGVPGHPVLLARAVLDRAGELAGDEGARGLLRGVRVRTWVADGLGDPRDVDVPADLLALADGAA
jgi:CTP:molybdopterin cytidylyltransferase MocA